MSTRTEQLIQDVEKKVLDMCSNKDNPKEHIDNLMKYLKSKDEADPREKVAWLIAEKSADAMIEITGNLTYELIQNAYDAFATEVDIRFKEDEIVFWHNGKKDFNLKDVIAINLLFFSNKEKEEEMIGEMGVGFKAVYKFSERPRIVSGGYSFQMEMKREEDDKSQHISFYPKWMEGNEREIGTTITLPLTNPDFFNKRKSEHQPERKTLLFLPNLKKIIFNGAKWTKKEKKDGIIELYENNKLKEKFRIWYEYNNMKRKKRLPQVALAIPIDNEEIPHNTEEKYNVYNFFRFKHEKLPLNFLIHARFHPDTTRKGISSDEKHDKHNQKMLGKIEQLFLHKVVKDLIKTEKGRIGLYKILPAIIENVDCSDVTRDNIGNRILNSLKDMKIFRDSGTKRYRKGHEVKYTLDRRRYFLQKTDRWVNSKLIEKRVCNAIMKNEVKSDSLRYLNLKGYPYEDILQSIIDMNDDWFKKQDLYFFIKLFYLLNTPEFKECYSFQKIGILKKKLWKKPIFPIEKENKRGKKKFSLSPLRLLDMRIVFFKTQKKIKGTFLSIHYLYQPFVKKVTENRLKEIAGIDYVNPISILEKIIKKRLNLTSYKITYKVHYEYFRFIHSYFDEIKNNLNDLKILSKYNRNGKSYRKLASEVFFDSKLSKTGLGEIIEYLPEIYVLHPYYFIEFKKRYSLESRAIKTLYRIFHKMGVQDKFKFIKRNENRIEIEYKSEDYAPLRTENRIEDWGTERNVHTHWRLNDKISPTFDGLLSILDNNKRRKALYAFLHYISKNWIKYQNNYYCKYGWKPKRATKVRKTIDEIPTTFFHKLKNMKWIPCTDNTIRRPYEAIYNSEYSSLRIREDLPFVNVDISEQMLKKLNFLQVPSLKQLLSTLKRWKGQNIKESIKFIEFFRVVNSIQKKHEHNAEYFNKMKNELYEKEIFPINNKWISLNMCVWNRKGIQNLPDLVEIKSYYPKLKNLFLVVFGIPEYPNAVHYLKSINSISDSKQKFNEIKIFYYQLLHELEDALKTLKGDLREVKNWLKSHDVKFPTIDLEKTITFKEFEDVFFPDDYDAQNVFKHRISFIKLPSSSGPEEYENINLLLDKSLKKRRNIRVNRSTKRITSDNDIFDIIPPYKVKYLQNLLLYFDLVINLQKGFEEVVYSPCEKIKLEYRLESRGPALEIIELKEGNFFLSKSKKYIELLECNSNSRNYHSLSESLVELAAILALGHTIPEKIRFTLKSCFSTILDMKDEYMIKDFFFRSNIPLKKFSDLRVIEKEEEPEEEDETEILEENLVIDDVPIDDAPIDDVDLTKSEQINAIEKIIPDRIISIGSEELPEKVTPSKSVYVELNSSIPKNKPSSSMAKKLPPAHPPQSSKKYKFINRDSIRISRYATELKEKYYAYHCQICLGIEKIKDLIYEKSYSGKNKNRKKIMEAHHINEVVNGGHDFVGNYFCLCKYHHDMIGNQKFLLNLFEIAVNDAKDKKIYGSSLEETFIWKSIDLQIMYKLLQPLEIIVRPEHLKTMKIYIEFLQKG